MSPSQLSPLDAVNVLVRLMTDHQGENSVSAKSAREGKRISSS